MQADYRPMRNSTEEPAVSPQRKRDPFYVVRDKVQLLVATLRKDFEKWKDVLENTNTAENADFLTLSQSIKDGLSTVKVDLLDLQQTVTIVESKRSRFKDIDDEELESRQRFCNEIAALLQGVGDELGSPRVAKKVEKDQRAKNNTRKAGARLDRVNRSEGQGYVEGQRQQQQQMEQKQDVVLDDMSAALGRLGDVSSTINTELATQADMLDDFHSEMDEAEANMSVVMKKMTKLLGTSDKGRLCCIFGLFGLAVFLLMLIIYI